MAEMEGRANKLEDGTEDLVHKNEITYVHGEIIRKKNIKEVRDRKSKRNEIIELKDKVKIAINYCIKRMVRSRCRALSELVDMLILWQAVTY